MRLVLISLAAALTAATPALANEARVEARGGIAFAGGNSEAVAGIAAGYDWDLGEKTFIGVEASADKVLVSGADVVFGASARFGAKVSENGKLYALAGYSFSDGYDTPHGAVGYEHAISGNAYAKVEYRRFFINNSTDLNAAVVGVGVSF